MKCVEDICWEKTLTYQGAHQWGRLKSVIIRIKPWFTE